MVKKTTGHLAVIILIFLTFSCSKQRPIADIEPTPENTHTFTQTSTITHTSTVTPIVTATPPAGWTLVWSDEFDGPSIDSGNWGYDTGAWPYNSELEYYTTNTTNSYIENGNLVIQALEESMGGRDYTSARLVSKNKVHYTYGKIVARMKLPFGQGIWPAFWMMGESAGWPACGEIDIMEMIGGGENRDDTHHCALHWDDGGHQQIAASTELPDPHFFFEDYHIFGIEWNTTEIKWFLDGNQFYSYDITPAVMSEFHWDHHLLLNVAVGGSWPGNPDATTVFPQKMYVDWIHWYQ